MKQHVKKRYENLKCSYRKCRSKHVSWVIDNLGSPPSAYNMIKEPIGFCSSAHLEAFMSDYNSGYYLTGSDIIVRKKGITKRRNGNDKIL